MSDLQKKLLTSKLPPMMPPPRGVHGAKRVRNTKNFTPVSWDNYFEKMSDIRVNETDTFRLYESGETGPVCFFLHGGGFSALSWAVLSKLLTRLVHCRCAAMDIRGHGDTKTTQEDDLSADVLADDVLHVISTHYGDDPPPILLVGHSMGGAIAVHVAKKNVCTSLCGLAVIDVVEGTAMEALASMQTFLRGRPTAFKSLEHAIEYCVKTGQIKNIESAKVSMAGHVKRLGTNETGAYIVSHQHSAAQINTVSKDATETITEAEEEQDESAAAGAEPVTTNPPAAEADADQYVWRIDLSKTEKYWKGWFEGLSQMFLSCTVPKMLLLAGVDRLDKHLTVGQMQGKFQMQVLPQCGHTVHEDSPDKVADVIASFLVRNRLAEPTANYHSNTFVI